MPTPCSSPSVGQTIACAKAADGDGGVCAGSEVNNWTLGASWVIWPTLVGAGAVQKFFVHDGQGDGHVLRPQHSADGR